MPSRQGVLAQGPRDPSLTSLKNPSYFAPNLSIVYYALLFGCHLRNTDASFCFHSSSWGYHAT